MTDPASSATPSRSKGLDRALIVAIVGMGVLLLVGVLTVFGTIGYRIANAGSLKRVEGALAIPTEGALKTLSLDGDRVALGLATPQGEFVLIYDLASGREVGRLRLETPNR